MRYEVEVSGEALNLGWEDGRLVCDGYDVENEKLALALNGGATQGVSLFLSVLDRLCKKESDLETLISAFRKEVPRLDRISEHGYSPDNGGTWESELLLHYMSYSENPKMRWIAAREGNFDHLDWARLTKDKHLLVLYEICKRSDVPIDLLEVLAARARPSLLLDGLIQNPSINKKIWEIIFSWQDMRVQRSLALSPNTPKDILVRLITERGCEIEVAERENLDRDLIELILQQSNISTLLSLAENTKDIGVMEKLMQYDNVTRIGLARNKRLPEKLKERLRQDQSPMVREEMDKVEGISL